nr:copia protein [Tanacetum cinerariifolium]
MKVKFQMSSMGELTFFLGLQVKQKDNGIFISQDKYVDKILRKFGLTYGKSASTPIDTEKPLLKDLDSKTNQDCSSFKDYQAQVEGLEVGEEEEKQAFRVKEIKEGGIAELDANEDATLVDVDAEVEMDTNIQGRMDTDEAEPTKVEEVLEVVTASKLMTKVVTTAAQVPKASSLRRRRGVVIQDPEETVAVSVIVHSKV